jgi:C-terminal processing protease CtpA/Prc
MPEPGGMFRDSSAGALRLTTQNFYSPDGRKMRAERNPDGSKVEGTGGVEPDVSVPLTEEQAAAIKDYIDAQLFGDPAPEVQDPVVDKAVEILTQEPV